MTALHVHEFGDPDGRPLLCLHGLTGHGARFRPLAGLLPGRRLICPDLRGHGRSTYAPPWTTEQFAADVLAALPDGPQDWLGFSFGGRIAATVAAAAPDRVERLVLLDPALTLEPGLAAEMAEESLAPADRAGVAEAVDEQLAAGTLFRVAREVLEADVREHYERREDGRLHPRVSRPMTVTAWSEMARPAPPRPTRPTLVVTGDRSWLPVDASAVAPAAHAEVPGGHSVLWDALEETAGAIRGFLP